MQDFKFYSRERAARIYMKIVNRGQDRDVVYKGEWHHILPKAHYPEYSTEDWNIVKLTVKEHVFVHHLLAIMYQTPEMVRAYILMTNDRDTSLIQSAKMRELASLHQSQLMVELWQDSHYREVFSESTRSARQRNWQDPDYREKMKNHARTRFNLMWQDPEFQKVRSETASRVATEVNLRLWQDPDYRARMLASCTCEWCGSVVSNHMILGRDHGTHCTSNPDYIPKKPRAFHGRKPSSKPRKLTKPMVRTTHICPHCGKEGAGPNMKRYHFDKCKSKPDEQ